MKYLNCINNISLLYKIEQIKKQVKNNLVFLCLGNRFVNFDSFASIVAEKLKVYNVGAYVYGGEDCPLYGDNLILMKKFLEKYHKNDTIVFIDVVKTTKFEENSKIVVSSKKYKIANSNVNFNYDYSICYYVTINDKINHHKLQSEAAEKISLYIRNCLLIF